METDYLRMRAYPFTPEVHDFVAEHERVYVVEQNRDAQMLQLLKLDIAGGAAYRKLRSVLHFNGLPIDARSVTDEIVAAGRSSQVNGNDTCQYAPAAEDEPHRTADAGLSRRQDHAVRRLRP